MIKLLSILGSLGMIGTSTSTVTACGSGEKIQKLNFTPLDQAIQKADDRLKNGVDKPKVAHERLNGVVEEAKLQRQKADKQEIINKTTETVETEIVIFDSTMQADKTALRLMVAEAKELLATHHKKRDVEISLQSTIDMAEEVLNDSDVIQSKVDQTLQRLEVAIELFNSYPDLSNKTQLQEKINLANQLVKSSHKTTTVTKKLLDAVTQAQAVFDKEAATQVEVDQAVVDLEVEVRVFQGAANLADKTALKAKIAEAKMMLENNTNASEMAKEFFGLSISAAEMTVADENVSQENVNITLKNLQLAMEAFAHAQLVDKTKLEIEIKKAEEAKNNSNKSSVVTEVLQIAITNAQAVFNKETATQVEVDQAVVDLKVEMRIFESAIDLANKTALKAKIVEANKLLEANRNNKASYTIEAMELAINVAQTIMDKETSAQDEVDNTTAKLDEAIQIFNKSPNLAKDKSELGKLIVEAKALLENNADKNDAAKQFFKLFIEFAEETFNDPDATESDVALEIKGLKVAIKNFENAELI